MAGKVITANTFDRGAVVYLGRARWVSEIAEARVFTTDEEVEESLRNANAMPDRLIGAYAIEVRVIGETISPVSVRERIRALGPGNYFHGKQAGDEAEHVSVY